MCTCDLERPDIFQSVYRKARKQHKCSECGCSIEAGSKYTAISGLWDGQWGHFKQCLECEAIASHYMIKTDCCLCIGDLYQELIDSDFLNFVEETQRWESSVAWLQISSQKPLRCVFVKIEEAA